MNFHTLLLVAQCFGYFFLAMTTAIAQESPVGGQTQTLQTIRSLDHNISTFGQSVADAGDLNFDGYSDLLAGAPTANRFGKWEGGAFVFSGYGGSMLRYFHNISLDSGVRVAHSVANGGDVNGDGIPDQVIGSPFIDTFGGKTGAGSVEVYSGADGSLIHSWHSGDKQAFGISVSSAGDWNQDGYSDILVGSSEERVAGNTYAGSAFIYSGFDGSILLRLDGGAPSDFFGSDVANAGDLNHDGIDDILIVAPYTDFNGTNGGGSVYGFSGGNGDLLFRVDGGVDRMGGGMTVCSAGDVDRDGTPDILIGTPYHGGALILSGLDRHRLFRFGPTATWTGFGKAVAGGKDINLDGYDDFLISAPNHDSQFFRDAGAVYLFSGYDGSLIQQWQGDSNFANLGKSIGWLDDQNHDGLVEVMFGSGNWTENKISVHSFQSFLYADEHEISASAGGQIQFSVQFPLAFRDYDYKILLSQSGIGPTDLGILIPLSLDQLFFDSFFGNYPFRTYSGMQGRLNEKGTASAKFSLPPGLPSSLIGQMFFAAAVAHQPNQLPEQSSVFIPIQIIP
jgi:FG-GAP repeat